MGISDAIDFNKGNLTRNQGEHVTTSGRYINYKLNGDLTRKPQNTWSRKWQNWKEEQSNNNYGKL